MEMLGRMSGVVFGAWRVAWCMVILDYVETPSLALLCYVLVESMVGTCSSVNAFIAKQYDASWRGWVIPIVYTLGGFVAPVQDAVAVASLEWLLISVQVFRMYAHAVLGFGITVGVPSFVRLVESGPYAYIRHPIGLSSVLSRLAFLCVYPCWWNAGVAVWMVAAVLAVIWSEESFLRRVPEWRAYAERVRWRMVPGVF